MSEQDQAPQEEAGEAVQEEAGPEETEEAPAAIPGQNVTVQAGLASASGAVPAAAAEDEDEG